MNKETRNILIGAGVLGLLLLLWKRSKSSAGTNKALPTGSSAAPSTPEDVASDVSVDASENQSTDVDLNSVNSMKSQNFLNITGGYAYVLTSTPDKGGSASLSGSILTYTPAKDFVGTESVNYKIVDGDGASSNVATITFTVVAVYDGAPAKDISQTVQEDGSISFDIAGTGSGSETGGDGFAEPTGSRG